jgi:hypothetical protein
MKIRSANLPVILCGQTYGQTDVEKIMGTVLQLFAATVTNISN